MKLSRLLILSSALLIAACSNKKNGRSATAETQPQAGVNDEQLKPETHGPAISGPTLTIEATQDIEPAKLTLKIALPGETPVLFQTELGQAAEDYLLHSPGHANQVLHALVRGQNFQIVFAVHDNAKENSELPVSTTYVFTKDD